MNQNSYHSGSNGYVEAPPVISGASSPVARPKRRRTVFLPDVPVRSLASAYYAGRRFLLGGAPVARYFTGGLALLAVIWATGLLPGRWIGVAAFLTAVGVHIVIGTRLKKRDYVTFHRTSPPAVPPQVCPPEDSLPVYVTGKLSVEGKHARFTCLPGFYKTFATREHALLCLARPREALNVIRWPEDEIGMWYAFFMPSSIRRIEWGVLSFGPEPMKAVAVEYELCERKQGKFGGGQTEQCSDEVLYIAAEDETILRRIIADIAVDAEAGEAVKSLTNTGAGT